MQQEMYMLPVRCKGCNTVFDLWRVLQEQESKEVASEEHELEKFLHQSLCPRCQQAVRMGLEEYEEQTEAEADDADSNDYEMMLDFE